MISSRHPDFYNDIIDSRFAETITAEKSHESISDDFYIDLLCAFHDPNSFCARDFMAYPIDSILMYLKQTHVLYTTKSLNDISTNIQELVTSDKKFEKLRTSLHQFFIGFRADLEKHILEEEKHLFPYIEALVAQPNATSGTGKTPLEAFLNHHDDSHEKDLQNLTLTLTNLSSYQDSFAFRMLINRLSLFELDLRIHAKMEEEVLLPMAIALEKKAQK